MNRILIIDDEENILTSLQFALEDHYEVYTCADPIAGLAIIDQHDIELVLLDLRIGKYNGISVLEKIKAKNSDIAVIMMTAYGSIKSSVDAIRAGAFYYVIKPVDVEELKILIDKALEYRSLNEKIEHLNDQLYEKYSFSGIIGNSDVMKTIFSTIEKIKDIDMNVLINGESGTGKELIAKAIHYQGIRKEERFEAINCAAIPEHLLESELFGFEKGAFSGAIKSKKGKFTMASKGTLFLDEIGEINMAMQSKLLRVLQERKLTPLGSNDSVEVDIRIIAATNKNLFEEVAKGNFREDLYYRLNVLNIKVAPLRERKEDISLLVEHFIKKYNEKLNKNIVGIDSCALNAIEERPLKGNVRELENLIQRAVALSDNKKLVIDDFPKQELGPNKYLSGDAIVFHVGESLKAIEKKAIVETLKKYDGNKKKAAKVLGVTDRTLRNKLNEYKEEQC